MQKSFKIGSHGDQKFIREITKIFQGQTPQNDKVAKDFFVSSDLRSSEEDINRYITSIEIYAMKGQSELARKEYENMKSISI